MKPSAPSSETMTAMAGIRVARPFLRNRKTTITTSTVEIARVRSTSASEARVVMVRSTARSRLTWGGSSLRRTGRAALMRSTVAMILAPGTLVTRTTMAGLPLARPSW